MPYRQPDHKHDYLDFGTAYIVAFLFDALTGTYNDQLLAAGVPCTACPGNTWTYDTQSTAATECEGEMPALQHVTFDTASQPLFS